MRVLAALALFALLASPALAAAQPAPQPPPVQNVIFDGDVLEGGLDTPEGSIMTTRPPTRFGSLIELRRDFAAELMASVSEL
ncbi:MAG: hypothetical protein P1V51_05620 [Deltaproteobacteria bacterium]|nr:hypothetical protein [Deltaproteobacteria bacterium]